MLIRAAMPSGAGLVIVFLFLTIFFDALGFFGAIFAASLVFVVWLFAFLSHDIFSLNLRREFAPRVPALGFER